MPLPNRVAPDGTLFADQARGLFLGIRGGRFHDPVSKALPRRIEAGSRWICCRLDFKNKRREVWGPQGYTTLFFCDEVTALAAGHRPCMECRREAALAYRAAAVAGAGLCETPAFPRIDTLLAEERRMGRAKRLHALPCETLPDGTMIKGEAGFIALKGSSALLWSPAGYVEQCPRPKGPVEVLTPPLSLAALRAGFAPVWHPTAVALR